MVIITEVGTPIFTMVWGGVHTTLGTIHGIMADGMTLGIMATEVGMVGIDGAIHGTIAVGIHLGIMVDYTVDSTVDGMTHGTTEDTTVMVAVTDMAFMMDIIVV